MDCAVNAEERIAAAKGRWLRIRAIAIGVKILMVTKLHFLAKATRIRRKRRLYYVLLMLCLCDCITTGREQQGTRESQLIKCTLLCQGVSSSDFLRHACEIGIIQHDASHAASPSIIEFIRICFILLKLNVAL